MSSKAKAAKGKKDPKKAAAKKAPAKGKAAAKAVPKGKAVDAKKGKTNKASAKAGNKGKAAPAKGQAKGGKKGDTKKGDSKKADTKKGNKGKDAKKDGKKGGKKADASEKKEESKEEDTKPAVKEINIGPPVILPKTEEFVTEIPAMVEFELKEDEDVEKIGAQFDEFISLLKKRKKECLTHMRTLIASDDEDTRPVCVDIDSMKNMLSNVGTKQGEKNYDVRVTRIRCLDKLKELLAYETKHASVSKQRERTSADIIEKEIADGQKVLDEAEPVLQQARDSLTKITKASLDEIRALPNPHPLLIKTVKACAILVGKNESDLNGWPNIKKLLKTTFVNDLIAFEARSITGDQRDLIRKDYLGTDNDDMDDSDKLTFENVNKANAVAGNLVTWLEAQLKYNEFIPKVEPMQARLKELAIELASIEGIVNKLDTALADLDKKITTAKQEVRDNGKTFDAAVQACKEE